MNTIIVKWVWAKTVAAPSAMPSAEMQSKAFRLIWRFIFILYVVSL